MEIKNSNTLLNILLPNDNKFIKEALQQADLSQLTTSSKSVSVEEIVLNLFKDISNGTKSNETILNILKNSNMFSEIKNFPKDLQTLSNLLQNSPTLQNFQTKINNFMLNITNINENNLKAQIDNSGIFLESKIGSSLKLLPNNFLDTLIQIKQDIQNIPTLQNAQSLQNTQNIMPLLQNILTSQNNSVTNLIDSIMNNNSNANTLLNDLKTLLNDLNSLKSNFLNINLKETFNSLENDITKLQTQFNKEINHILQELINTKQPNLIEHKISNDMKAVLLQLQQEITNNQTNKQDTQEISKTIDRLLAQIDYHQLMSITSNSNSLYLPFLWDLLDEGSLQVSKDNDEKFFCQINLKLKESGKLDLLVAMHKNDIEITMYAQQNSFKDKIKQNLPELRTALSSIGLTTLNIQIYDLKDNENKIEQKEQMQFFNSDLQELNFGIDIRV